MGVLAEVLRNPMFREDDQFIAEVGNGAAMLSATMWSVNGMILEENLGVLAERLSTARMNGCEARVIEKIWRESSNLGLWEVAGHPGTKEEVRITSEQVSTIAMLIQLLGDPGITVLAGVRRDDNTIEVLSEMSYARITQALKTLWVFAMGVNNDGEVEGELLVLPHQLCTQIETGMDGAGDHR